MPGSLARTTAPVAKMMRLRNYKEGAGLGAHGQGIVVPVKTEKRSSNAGVGHSEKPYDNGLPGAPAPPPAEDRWGEWAAASRALGLERDCYEKILALLRDMKLEGDDSAETADALAAIRALGAWRTALPPSAVQHIVEQVLAPRMAMKAREWEPVWNPGCDHWLRPWIPLIGHLPESLYSIFNRKDYFDPAHWEIFSRRHVLPRLTRWLQQLRITPPKQIDIKFRTVMEWAPLVRTEDAVSILEQEFFGKWESALRHWLQSAKTSPGEADAWCTGWKNLFTPELLDDERVLARLEVGAAIADRQTEDLNRLVRHS
ncbi:hypothetical protein VPH35_022368 [Triticum aestivum]